MIPNSHKLKEHFALTELECSNCKNDIELGDTCYIDDSKGIEFYNVMFYCEQCVDI